MDKERELEFLKITQDLQGARLSEHPTSNFLGKNFDRLSVEEIAVITVFGYELVRFRDKGQDNISGVIRKNVHQILLISRALPRGYP